jgi:hypothetical protein
LISRRKLLAGERWLRDRERYRRSVNFYEQQEDLDHLFEALGKAGLRD